ncbi:MAG: lysophospholipid acyltransferase family protein [Anaerolineae bacterium]
MRDAKNLFGSARAIRLGLFLSQHLPPRGGYGLARFAASFLSWVRPRMYWNLHANLRQVLGLETPAEVLHAMVRRTLFRAGCSYYEYFRAVGQPPEVLSGLLQVPDLFWETLEQARAEGRGVMMVTAHMGNFDLAALSLTARGLHLQALSVADPPPGFQLLNRLRQEAGVEVTPITETAIRQAVQRLKGGGMVFTGVDYPFGPGREPLRFFGRPALLPTGHVRLALMTGAWLMAVGVQHREGQGYVLRVEPPLEPVREGDRREGVRGLAERVLSILERWIRETPDQWFMFLPVWPELLERPAA